MDEKPDYEDADGKGISFEDFKAQVKADVRDEFEAMLDEACVTGELGALMTQTFQKVAISPRSREIHFEVPVISGGVERYVVTINKEA